MARSADQGPRRRQQHKQPNSSRNPGPSSQEHQPYYRADVEIRPGPKTTQPNYEAARKAERAHEAEAARRAEKARALASQLQIQAAARPGTSLLRAQADQPLEHPLEIRLLRVRFRHWETQSKEAVLIPWSHSTDWRPNGTPRSERTSNIKSAQSLPSAPNLLVTPSGGSSSSSGSAPSSHQRTIILSSQTNRIQFTRYSVRMLT